MSGRLALSLRAMTYRLPIVVALVVGSTLVTVSARAVNVACVGDSITAGSGLPSPSTQAYPAVLGTLLGTDYTVENFGVSGTTMLKNGDFPYWDTPRYTASD